ncbi:MAG: TonB-dependent receptor [Chitinophagaceae bacterium]
MKRAGIPVCAIFLSMCSVFAKDGKAQDLILKKHVRQDFMNVELKSAIHDIQAETGISFIYSSTAIGADRKINFYGSNKTLQHFVRQVLEAMNINFKITNKKIILFPMPDKAPGEEYGKAEQQDGKLKGTVKNTKGEAMADVTVQILDTKNVTVSDKDGNFAFDNLPAGEHTISFSHLGFLTLTQKITVSSGNPGILDIVLTEDILKLEDVIITSSGNARKKIESSVAVTTVSRKDLTIRAPLNATDMLKAVPGLQVESTGGDGPGNVWVRGFPQQGGYIFLGVMEDGLPLLPTGFNSSPSVDQYYKTDLTTKDVEAIRGGNASIIMANTPGAVINNLSYTGGDKQYGQIKYTDGLSQNLYRLDANTGGSISKNVNYNVGGFFRTDKGIVPPGFTANLGGQFKGNLTFNFKNNKGFVRVYGKYLNDKVQWMLTSYYPYDGSGKPKKYGSYDMVKQSIVPVDTKWDYTDDASNTSYHYDLSDGIHTKLGSGQVQFHYTTDNGWSINNNFRYQYTKVRTTAAVPTAISTYDGSTQYYYTDGTEAQLSSGDQIVADYTIATRAHDVQIIDYLDLKKSVGDHNLSLGTGIYQYNTTPDAPSLGFYSIQEFKEHPRRLLSQAPSSDYDGMTLLSSSKSGGNTRTLSAYATDEITLSDRMRVDVGFRYDNQNVSGDRPLSSNDYTQGTTHYSETVNNWAASLGLNYKISNTSAMFARATRAYNAPNIGDYGAYAYDASSIKKRPVYLGEIGYKYASNNWSIFASASYSAIKNVSLSISVPSLTYGTQTLLAFGSTRTWSGEFEVAYNPVKPLTLRLTGTLQDSKYTDYVANTALSGSTVVGILGDTTYSFTNKKVERVPPFNMEFSTSYDFKGFNIYLAARYVGPRYTSPSDSYKLPAYLIMNGGLGYNFNKHFGLRFWADNLNNVRALTEGDVRGDQFRDFSTVSSGTLMAGRALLPRSFWGSLTYTF